jgi:tRNA modification GTPase
MNRPAPPTETIAAIATAPGRGAVGILRLSGPQSGRIAEALCGVLPPPRQAALRHFRDATGQALDQGLVLVFPAPRSFTGEDVVELQGHGGPAVLNLLLAAACAAGARPARPGEFSERAFLNGRMDLAQAEAVADLIGAASAQAARAASRALDGALSKQVDALLEELTALRVFVEGALDFSDQDTPWLEDAALHQRFAALRSRLQQLLREADQGRRLRDGLVITLTGAPNVGKSTLMNRLAGADVAIVTDQPGTTRDTLREDLDLDGLPVTLVDTAGLRDSDDPIELLDDRSGLGSAERALAASLAPGPRLLFVHNKCDISGRAAGVFEQNGERHLRVSAAHGDGIDRLRAEIRAAAGLDSHGEGLFSARARHVDALRRTLDSVDAALHRIREGAHAELAAEELRLAQAALGEITGRFSSEDLLGAIFRSFCIGK